MPSNNYLYGHKHTLLRNGEIFADRTAAMQDINNLHTQGAFADGEIVTARYFHTENNVKTVRALLAECVATDYIDNTTNTTVHDYRMIFFDNTDEIFDNIEVIQGVQGTQGMTGAQGAQGTQGTQGNTGAQGATGAQGNVGAQGAKGAQGNVGAQGATGATGAQGNVGAQGATGAQGNVGAQGATGAQGNVGAQGAKGAQGNVGAQGATGAQGNVGAQGATGAQGRIGNTGAQGAQGTQGTKGDTGAQGATGAQGRIGNTGAQGATGATGAQGNVGAQGATGAQGNVGAQGAKGAQGNVGAQGATGAQGRIGNTGAQGATGATGAQGNVGAQGAKGAQGNVGAQGATGAQGRIGNTGAQGATGATGAQGNVGAQGATGAQGNVGAQGATGAQGRIGNTGAQGATGATGAQGNVGAQGATGAQGNVGAQGATGAQGRIGNTGAQGATGATGAQGNVGAQGAKGAQGNVGAQGAQGTQGLRGTLTWNTTTAPTAPNYTFNISNLSGNPNETVRVGDKITYSYYVYTITSVSTSTVVATRQSIRGATGATGAQGNVGAQGATGAQGNVGAQGAKGAQGNVGAQGATGAQGNVGAQGAKGAQGNVGAQGAKGAQGNVGAQGATGAQGNVGAQGAKGAQGNVGAQGAQGTQGVQGLDNTGFFDIQLVNPTAIDDGYFFEVSGYTMGAINGAINAGKILRISCTTNSLNLTNAIISITDQGGSVVKFVTNGNYPISTSAKIVGFGGMFTHAAPVGCTLHYLTEIFDFELTNGTSTGNPWDEQSYQSDKTVSEIYDAYEMGALIRVTIPDLSIFNTPLNIAFAEYDSGDMTIVGCLIHASGPWVEIGVEITQISNVSTFVTRILLYDVRNENALRQSPNGSGQSFGDINTPGVSTYNEPASNPSAVVIHTNSGFSYFNDTCTSQAYFWIIDHHRHWWDSGKGSYTFLDWSEFGGDVNLLIHFDYPGIMSNYAAAGAVSPAVFFNKLHKILIKVSEKTTRIQLPVDCINNGGNNDLVKLIAPDSDLPSFISGWESAGGIVTAGGKKITINTEKVKYIELNIIALNQNSVNSKSPTLLVLNCAPFGFEECNVGHDVHFNGYGN